MKRILALITFASVLSASAQNKIDLSGVWEFQIQRSENTVTPISVYDDTIQLPGSMITRDKGDIVSVNTQWTGSLYDSSFYFNPYMEKYRVEGQMKFPFFLTPERHYIGNALYRRKVLVPKEWRKQRIILTLERPHIETTVYINGKEIGHQMGLSAPHVYDVTDYIKIGRENTIAIKVYNGIENVCVGKDSHSVTDHTQGNWNGIAGDISLSARPMNAIEHIDVYPDVAYKSIRLVLRGKAKGLSFFIDGNESKAVALSDSSYVIRMGNEIKLWDEFHPYLYTLEIKDANGYSVSTIFGMREVKTEGMNIVLNGKPIYIRGTVGNCCFPETGYPPTDEASWERIFRKCKEYGLNTMRFHSYCPPEAAFRVADRLGFYLQPEGPSWPNHGVRLGRGMSIDQYLMDETKRMVEAYGNHPSFLMMSAGNEPAGDWVTWCNAWVDYWKETDSRRIYCGANVGGGWAWDNGSQYHVKGGGRGLDWNAHAPHSDDDYSKDILFPRNYKDSVPNNSPIICHEQGQWCAFPDLKERSQYTGAYKAKNFDIFEDLLRDNGMASQSEKFLMSSGKLQTLAYKYEIERNLRTKGYTGFVLLGLNDYSGQGTALVGPLNVHWKEKGYVDASEWTEFCNDVVPLAKFPKFVYSSSDTLRIPIEVYNASASEIEDATVEYSITESVKDKNGMVNGQEGLEYSSTLAIPPLTIPLGKNQYLGTVTCPLTDVVDPSKITLTVTISSGERKWKNHWDFWVMPSLDSETESVTAKVELRKGFVDGVYISDTLDDLAVQTLKRGHKVLLTAAGKVRYGNDIKQNYLPVFWNTSWFKMRPPHTTGAYIDNTHPIYCDFPTDDWTNLLWWELVNRAQVMNLSEFPADYQPPMQPIDTWHISRKCGMIIEANVLGGKLLMTTIDVTSNLRSRLIARQLRKSIINYMKSNDFKPTITLDESVIRHLYENEARQVNMFTKDSPDELKPKIK